jgi:hypothetical protein
MRKELTVLVNEWHQRLAMFDREFEKTMQDHLSPDVQHRLWARIGVLEVCIRELEEILTGPNLKD